MNFKTLDLNLLRVFDEVMAERSLTRAAQNLAMTQPAVSNAIKRLRDALGDDLVSRAGYGVEPTPKGLLIWPAVRQALGELRSTIAPEPFNPATTKQSFTLAMADATAALLMPHLVRELEQTGANITLRTYPLTTRDPRRLLEERSFDAAIGYFPAAIAAISAFQSHSSQDDFANHFSYSHLYSGEYVCVLRRQHPHLKKLKTKAISLDDYCNAHHLLVSFSGRPFGLIDEALAAINRKRLVVLTVNQFFTAGRVVANSDLLTVLPRHFLSSTGIEHELVALPLPFEVAPVHVDMVWHARDDKSNAHQWLREAVGRAGRQSFPARNNSKQSDTPRR
jgi:DNA-binding transcriptional LysR family regulator